MELQTEPQTRCEGDVTGQISVNILSGGSSPFTIQVLSIFIFVIFVFYCTDQCFSLAKKHLFLSPLIRGLDLKLVIFFLHVVLSFAEYIDLGTYNVIFTDAYNCSVTRNPVVEGPDGM